MAGMSQPTAYSRSTDFAGEESSNVGGRSTIRTAMLDAELDAVALTTDQIRANLAIIQRDDTKLRDGIVEVHALGSDVRALLAAGNITESNLKGAWLTATAYVKLDVVTQSSNTYICASNHTSGTFATDLAATKWILLAQGATGAAAIGFSPTATIAATNVQAAIDEADTENRALTAAVRTDLADVASTSKGVGMVGLDATLAYPVGTVGAHLRGFVNPLDDPYLAATDGVTDSTTAVANAVAHAYSTGKTMLWPNITFVTSSSIPNLHDVRHFGPGVIKRGSDLFYPDPRNTQTNTLYVTTAGSSSNDGLSASQPINEPQNALLAIKKYGPIVGGTWIISVANGTYTTRFDFRFKTTNPVKLIGPSWVTAPGAILDGASSLANILTVQDGAELYLERILATNCTDNCIEVQNGSTIEANEIHATNGGLSTSSGACFYVANQSRAIINGKGLLKNSDSSDGVLMAYGNSVVSVGQTGTSSADSPAIQDGATLVNAQHSSLIKLRRAYLDGISSGTSTYGVKSQSGSHVSHEAGTVDNVVAAYFGTHPGAILMNESSVTHTGITALRYRASVEGVQERPIEVDAAEWRLTKRYYSGTLTNATITGTTAKTNIVASALSLLTKDFNFKGRGFKVVIYGTITGTAGTKTFEINGSTAGSLRSIVAVAADAGIFRAELMIEVLSTAATTVDVLKHGRIVFDERSPQEFQQVATDNLSAAQDINVTGQLSNSADSIATTLVEVYELGL